jgi:C_GCAxxG_C_C family probable redox protein
LLAVGEHVLDDLKPQAMRMATGVSGGLGNTRQELCGALSGGVLLIGALYGRVTAAEDDQRAIDIATGYRDRFLEKFGHTQCAQLRENVVDPPGGLGSCGALVEQAARILLDLLTEEAG